MSSLPKFGSIFKSVRNTVKTSSGSAINIVICLVTVGSEQLFSFAAFQCPCPAKNSTFRRNFQQNYLYGWVFILVPAMALFVLGYGINLKTQKLVTGCIRRSERASRGYVAGCSTLFEICMQALVAPMAWMSVAFLDGKYYACAESAVPYVKPCHVVATKTIFSYTEEFDRNKRRSQIIGWCLVAVTLFFGSLFYMLHRCLSPLTYHHRKYARWYREIEAATFEIKAKEQIRKEVEEETVERFLQDKRSKHDWDKVSTVFNFTTDDRKFALYSRLDEWNEKNKGDYPLPREVEQAKEAKEGEAFAGETNGTKNNNNNNFGPNATTITKKFSQNQKNALHAQPHRAAQNNSMDQSKEPLVKIGNGSPSFDDETKLETSQSSLTNNMTSKQNLSSPKQSSAIMTSQGTRSSIANGNGSIEFMRMTELDSGANPLKI